MVYALCVHLYLKNSIKFLCFSFLLFIDDHFESDRYHANVDMPTLPPSYTDAMRDTNMNGTPDAAALTNFIYSNLSPEDRALVDLYSRVLEDVFGLL